MNYLMQVVNGFLFVVGFILASYLMHRFFGTALIGG